MYVNVQHRYAFSTVMLTCKLLFAADKAIVDGHMEKQEMEMEMETEMKRKWKMENGNSFMVVPNHWTGLLLT